MINTTLKHVISLTVIRSQYASRTFWIQQTPSNHKLDTCECKPVSRLKHVSFYKANILSAINNVIVSGIWSVWNKYHPLKTDIHLRYVWNYSSHIKEKRFRTQYMDQSVNTLQEKNRLFWKSYENLRTLCGQNSYFLMLHHVARIISTGLKYFKMKTPSKHT